MNDRDNFYCFHCESHCGGKCEQRVAAEGHWLPISIAVLVVLLAVAGSCALVGCGMTEIREHATDAIDNLTASEKQLVDETTALFGQLVDVREAVVAVIGTASQYAQSHGDDELASYFEDAAEQIGETLTESLRRHAEFLEKARAPVIAAVIANLNAIHKIALDNESLFALLKAPLGIFGVKFPEGGRTLPPPPTTSGGLGFGAVAGIGGASVLVSLLLVEGGKKGIQGVAQAVAKRGARKASQLASMLADSIPGDGRTRPRQTHPDYTPAGNGNGGNPSMSQTNIDPSAYARAKEAQAHIGGRG